MSIIVGSYRCGFAGTTSFALKDYRIDYDLELALQEVESLPSGKGIHE
ncbi:MAG: hypothetical protein KJP15_11825 [Gammaproteobacteria bacterium]|nr:hypothetical protein [Gammaproteobacteria bacterium]